MKLKLASLCLLVLLAAASASAQPSISGPVLDASAMDRTVDPCVDFYAYSCGGWIKKNPIPPDQSSWGTYNKLEDENRAQLRAILEEAANANRAREASTQKIGDYYASCMDEAAIERLGTQPLSEELKRIALLKSKQNLAGYVTSAQFPPSLYEGGPLFSFRSNQDFGDATQVIAEADQGGLGLPDRDYYLKNDAKSEQLRKAYETHVTRMFELLGDKPDDAANRAATVLRIETALALGQMTRVERRNPPNLYHKMKVEELQRLAPAFSWQDYLAATGIGPIASLNVVTPGYFQVMSDEIAKESLADWKIYLRWHAVHDAAIGLSSRHS
jgi:putative endopeptidase